MASDDLPIFEHHRAALRALAYRMLGDTASADDIVQEAWIRWQGRDVRVDNPRAYLLTVTARLCLNQLGSARARREQLRSWLPEPIEVEDRAGIDSELAEQVSMAFLVALQRLTPAERAVLLLHEVFDLSHGELATLLHKTPAATRQILHRARQGLADRPRVAVASPDAHRRLLHAFADAARSGDVARVAELLADDAVLITDGGEAGVRAGRVRNLVRPLRGKRQIAAFLTAADPRAWRHHREHLLNGEPAMVVYRDDRPFAALFIAVANGKILRIFIQADPARLGQIASA